MDANGRDEDRGKWSGELLRVRPCFRPVSFYILCLGGGTLSYSHKRQRITAAAAFRISVVRVKCMRKELRYDSNGRFLFRRLTKRLEENSKT